MLPPRPSRTGTTQLGSLGVERRNPSQVDQPNSDGLQPTSDGLQPTSDGHQPKCDGLQSTSDGLQPNSI